MVGTFTAIGPAQPPTKVVKIWFGMASTVKLKKPLTPVAFADACLQISIKPTMANVFVKVTVVCAAAVLTDIKNGCPRISVNAAK